MINPKIPVSLIDDPQMLGLLRETQCEVLGPWGVSLVEIQMALGRATLRAGLGPTQDSPFFCKLRPWATPTPDTSHKTQVGTEQGRSQPDVQPT